MLGVRRIGEQDENTLLLFDSGQVEQIGIRMDDESAVRIGQKTSLALTTASDCGSSNSARRRRLSLNNFGLIGKW